MARDALLNTLSTINDGTAVWSTGTLGDGISAASGTTYYSQTQAITPYLQTGTSQLLFMRFSLGTMITTGVPTTNAVNGFQFAVQASKDGSTWTTISASPKDLSAYRVHNTLLPTMATNSAIAYVPHSSTSQTSGALTIGSASIPGAPLVAVNDVVYMSASSGFAANTPYYVISSVPTGAGTAPRATIQVSLTPGGVPILATATTAITVTEYYAASPLQINDRFAVGNSIATATGTDGPSGTAVTLVTGDVIVITSAYNTGTSMAITFRRIVGATVMTNNYVHTNATALGTTAFYLHSDTGGEYFLPILTQVGYQSISGFVEDNYKFVRGIAACQINTVVPQGKMTCDIVTSRDGAYS